jgi:tetratricopeptide (TPR) repeat protein
VTRRSLTPIIAVAAGILLLAAAGVLALRGQENQPGSSAGERAAATASAAAAGSVAAAIAQTQAHLKEYPNDAGGWATLGSAYVQQARIGGDPTYYPKAEGALKESLRQQPDRNVAALTGLGALANARHDFAQARDWARKAEAADPFDATARGVEDDALTQLGDYAGARLAAQKMLDLVPGIPSFTRASYHYEMAGNPSSARHALEQALGEASQPSDISYCRYYLGELAFNEGDPAQALREYRAGLAVDPDNGQLLAGRAKARAATGDLEGAQADYAVVVARLPLAQYLLEYAELLQMMGREPESRQQLDLIGVEDRLMAANGVVDDLTASQVAADHGTPDDAVRHAKAEWSRRKSVLVADALAWALHRAGNDDEARKYAITAGRLGWRNATFSYHRGMIEMALGNRAAARQYLTKALDINPHFSLVQAVKAKSALKSLKGS